uniref:F-box domain-containing protein n=1 Tax=Attheya septentrionalis TaxID=420275 RepID=A0A7S2ULZ8_9STRA|mmetsp:Transcript_2868/g.5214  ORF Transcript_2868/g.5214 Transcript_2868/m.5214 type:complete len:418 (+) Transcript_2868:377-1630(+)
MSSILSLPADICGHILDHVSLKDALNATATCKFFCDSVSSEVSRIFVTDGRQLNVSRAAVAKFCKVEAIYVYTLIKEVGPDHDQTRRDAMQRLRAEHPDVDIDDVVASIWAHEREYFQNQHHLDVFTMQNILTFLKAFPCLRFAFLGGLCECSSGFHCKLNDDNARVDVKYKVSANEDYDSGVDFIDFHDLIKNIFNSIQNGELSSKLEIEGIIPFQESGQEQLTCAWRALAENEENFQTDQCTTCNLICNSISAQKIMSLHDNQIPCISREERSRIAVEKLTSLLIEKVTNPLDLPVMGPPNMSHVKLAAHFDTSLLTEIGALIKEGANARDPRLREALVKKQTDRKNGKDSKSRPGWSQGNDIRAITSAGFLGLKNRGFDIHHDDFEVVAVDTHRKRKRKESLMIFFDVDHKKSE